MFACKNGHTQIVELMLKNQIDPNVQKNNGWNALMSACKNGHTQIVELLLKEQIDPNIQKNDGWNALMLASAKGHYEVVKLLLEWKADPTIKSNEGKTALKFAKTMEISVLLNSYLREHIEQEDDAASASFTSRSSIKSASSTLSLLSLDMCNVSGNKGYMY
ncbi:PREDICTED: ankyrin repeat family A protein 2-like [Amphimedon queenslandica]|nr:PREDICTED: ankyrin repeat family A protein 2-like [Amphimedon queenslandica]|eukprot:XP_019857054.1 PREDICTED: ankyrin repeat family A protein 2-like [Amphimedon queenslandica]